MNSKNLGVQIKWGWWLENSALRVQVQPQKYTKCRPYIASPWDLTEQQANPRPGGDHFAPSVFFLRKAEKRQRLSLFSLMSQPWADFYTLQCIISEQFLK